MEQTFPFDLMKEITFNEPKKKVWWGANLQKNTNIWRQNPLNFPGENPLHACSSRPWSLPLCK